MKINIVKNPAINSFDIFSWFLYVFFRYVVYISETKFSKIDLIIYLIFIVKDF